MLHWVSTVVETLASVTNIRPADQILMCDGSRLEPARDLSAYRLPGPPGAGIKDVFLYNKSNLRPNAPPRPVESAVPVPAEEPPAPQLQSAPHALDSASSPLVKALAQYERQFNLHLQEARAGLWAARHRFTHCSTLVSEMDVQSRAIDSARTNVETHYTYIHNQIAAFMQRYTLQHRSHAEVLAGLEGELLTLEAVDLHPAACTAEHTKLVHLVDAGRLRDWAAQCSACHQSLAHKVAGLEEVFGALKADVEAVFMQGPTVQLEAVAVQLQALQPHLDELTSMVEVLESDKLQIKKLVAAAQQELDVFGGGASGGVTPLDTCQLLETMHDNHTSHLGPQVQHYRALFERFYQHCLADKNQMTRDVSAQLQRISGQQMKIQSIRNKLVVFREAAAKGEDMFGQLLRLQCIPAAYRHCLAECMRRQAFAELYGTQARQLAERIGTLREKERDMRDGFLKQVQPYIPAAVLAGLGLLHQPPHCQVSLPAQPQLPSVTPADLQRTPLSSEPAALAAASLSFGTAARSASQAACSSPEAITGEERESQLTESLQVENARLRAELAVRVAEECIQSSTGPAAEASSQRGLPHGNEGHPHTARSSTATSASSSDASKFQAALAAKQELVHQLERSLAHERHHVRNYESRIHALEARLADQATRSRLKEPAAFAARDSASSSYSRSGSGSLPGVTVRRRAAPLALTPVSTSPTRSVSPASRPAVASSTELLEGGVSSSLGAVQGGLLRSEQTSQHLASQTVADTAGQESTRQESTAMSAAVTGLGEGAGARLAPSDVSGEGDSLSGNVPGSDGQQ